MHRVATSLLIVGCLASPAGASQAGGGNAPASTSAIRACSLLTKEMVEPFSENKKVLDYIKPTEEPYAGSGSACNYGAVRLQIAQARADSSRKAPVSDVQTLSGVGDTAYFRNNKDRYAELIVWSGPHYLMLQVPVATGSTAEATKPATIALVKAIIAKLR